MQSIKVRDFCDLMSQGGKIPFLSDQQIQMLTWEEAQRRCEQLEHILLAVLDYDIVLSDTNIWLELLVGHSSSHSDPRVNARLQFERQLESLSKMMKRIGGRFMVMSETYEEIDRFATAQEPVNYKDADWNDEALCRNVAARLAKRLMLAQQKENRLRIEGIGSFSLRVESIGVDDPKSFNLRYHIKRIICGFLPAGHRRRDHSISYNFCEDVKTVWQIGAKP